jgi:hypothetical protein
MTDNNTIGELGLENLMSRANIIFTNGYKFCGKLNIDNLQQSFINIVDSIAKFQHQLHSKSQNNYQWQTAGPFKQRFLVVESENIEDEFKNICSRSFDIIKQSNHFPMVMVVIVEKQKPEKDSTAQKNFIIAQLSNHTYVDAGSSEVIFNQVVSYYNSLSKQDVQKTEAILEAAKNIKTIDTQSMLDLLKKENFEHQKNVDQLGNYPIADIGEHKVPLDTIPLCLESYKKRIRKPIVQLFNIDLLIQRCRNSNPDLSRNSIICAAIAKGMYDLNVEIKGKSKEHIISFKMLSNLLPEDMKAYYSGNYIAFVPVTVNGHESLEEIANDIQARVTEFKQTQLNLSLFGLVEDAVQASAVGEADEEISFIVTSWNNYSFMNSKDYLTDCDSITHYSGVNIEPKDTLGGSLVNRPVMVISLSPDGRLCLSYFPSLRSDMETQQIAKQMDKIFNRI